MLTCQITNIFSKYQPLKQVINKLFINPTLLYLMFSLIWCNSQILKVAEISLLLWLDTIKWKNCPILVSNIFLCETIILHVIYFVVSSICGRFQH